jgi:hypothetical protein
VHADTEAGVVVERGDEERHKRKQLFSLGQMAEKAIRECVDGDMHHPQPMPSTLSRRSPVTRCERWGDMAQFLDVEMQEVAERGVLVADDRHSGLDFGHAIELEPAQNAADGGATESGVLGMRKPIQRWRRKASTRRTVSSGVGWRSRCGRELRSRRPAAPLLR